MTIAVPPKYAAADFTEASFWSNRGKLDVPKERFVSYPKLGPGGEDLYGWAGWDQLDQARALAALYRTRKTQDRWPAEKLLPILAGLGSWSRGCTSGSPSPSADSRVRRPSSSPASSTLSWPSMVWTGRRWTGCGAWRRSHDAVAGPDRHPESVGEGDFVVRAAEGADLDNYVVTDQLQQAFGDALKRIGHAMTTGRSQAKSSCTARSAPASRISWPCCARSCTTTRQREPSVAWPSRSSRPTRGCGRATSSPSPSTCSTRSRSSRRCWRATYSQITALHPERRPAGGTPLRRAARGRGEAARGSRRREVLRRLSAAADGPARAGAAWRSGWRGRPAGPRRPTPRPRRPASRARRERDVLVSALTATFFHGRGARRPNTSTWTPASPSSPGTPRTSATTRSCCSSTS